MSEQIVLSKLTSVSYNPRIISTEQLERLKSSIKEHTSAIPEDERGDGFRLTTTVTVNRNGNRIVGGHQRIKALNSLGQTWIHKDDITWIELEPDSPHEKALNVTLNSERVSGEWNQKKLDEIVVDIKVDNPELFDSLDLSPVEVQMPSIDVSTIVSSQPKVSPPEPIIPDKPEIEEDSEDNVEEPEEQPEEPEEIGEEAVEETEKPIQPSGSQLFPVSYAVTSEQRTAILDAINKCKSNHEIVNSSAALAKVCEIWDNNQDEEVKDE